ncbi:hypothetical protein [Sphingomonas abietis]|uniref:Uncharacterized protein n=1 Tax=Sphingomonas abietis TaxID=3012344 RepID=A0ABY7NSJ1_9SPHN|nr:hypothetical protein [Sphingomonas abietis]WBO24475.1 hypothetical protein PBT88_10410 [Sphingomonas abietis]
MGLLTQRDVSLLGPNFDRMYPIDETPHFAELLKAIDDADRRLLENRDGKTTPPD